MEKIFNFSSSEEKEYEEKRKKFIKTTSKPLKYKI